MLRVMLKIPLITALQILIVAGFTSAVMAQDENDSFSVYYNNPENWDQVYAYTWEEGDGEYVEWPGEPMTEPVEGSQWYSYEIPDNFNRVIFNNAGEGEQTADLIRNTDGWFDGTQWYNASPDESFFIQIIHASADPAAAEVDIYVNADPAEDDPFLAGVSYQDATGYVDLDPDVDYNISLTGAGSEEVVYSIDVPSDLLQAGDVFVAVARGDFNTGEKVADEHTAFGIDLLEGRLAAEEEGNVDIQIYHAVTDAPAVDVWVRDTEEPLVANLEFGSGTDGYLSVPADLYYLDIYAAGESPDDTEPLQSFRLEAEGAGGQTAIGLATGYIAGIGDNDISPFEVMFAFADGTTVFPANVTSSEEIFDELPGEVSLSQNYPNPFNPATNIRYQIPSNMHVELTVYNTLGQKVATLVDDQLQAGTHEISFDGSSLASGVYIYRLQADGQVLTNQMTLVK